MKAQKYTLQQLQDEVTILEYKMAIKKELIQNEVSSLKSNLTLGSIVGSLFNLKFGAKNATLKNRALSGALGIGLGLLSQRIMNMSNPGIVRKGLGTLLHVGVTKYIASNPQLLQSVIGKISSLLGRRAPNTNQLTRKPYKANTIAEYAD
jgi:hypothetical protein